MTLFEQLKKARRNILGKIRILLFRLNFKNIKVGPGFFCGRHVHINRANKVRAGKNLKLGRYVHIASHVDFGDNVMVASFVGFVGGDHNFDNIGDIPMNQAGVPEWKTTIVEDDVWIGHGVTILAGVRIKSGAIVAAGAVVTRDVESNSIVGGIPAKEIRKRIIKEG